MTANLGKTNRLVRIIVGALLFILPLLNMPAIWSSAALAYGSMAIGAVLILTAFFKFCPLYRIVGLSTCKV